ncbi:DUF72 domain-containing protein [Chitinophaga agrisoli]|uniref:DUF72 domain-containing protein n=1 Tax=Chitinophaga agrisoli TaxID=2607653 RepID=A0A5B2W213_9BACT|nr:DUF72 domain-containing protein [Chitinophaga agrisoli]KAA2245084.1 DUF72 domain-containing protein [Chitinophaga agrisoli]
MKKANTAWHIGTSGWSYKHWKGLYYPEKMKPVDYLAFYSQEYDCAEINTSFYHLPKVETVQHWVEQVPRSFLFCPKLNRYITHFKKLHDPAESMQRFFGVFDTIEESLGPILVQLPANATFNPSVTAEFYRLLATTYKQYDFSMEVRDKSWYSKESLALMEKYGIGLVIAHSGKRFPYKEAVTANHVYLRFHGPRELYASGYATVSLRAYARKCAQWLKEKHKLWIFFNNDVAGHALEDSRKLKTMITEAGY